MQRSAAQRNAVEHAVWCCQVRCGEAPARAYRVAGQLAGHLLLCLVASWCRRCAMPAVSLFAFGLPAHLADHSLLAQMTHREVLAMVLPGNAALCVSPLTTACCVPGVCCCCRQLMSLSFVGMGVSMLAMAAGLALPFLSGA